MHNFKKTADGKIIFRSFDTDQQSVSDWCVLPFCTNCGPLSDQQIALKDFSYKGKPEPWYVAFCDICGELLPEQEPIKMLDC